MQRKDISVFVSRLFRFVFKCVVALVILEAVLQVWGSVRLKAAKQEARKSDEFVILALGESTTTSEYPNSWPSQLGDMLSDKYPDITFRIVNRAKTGVQTNEVVGNIEQHIRTYQPDIIVSMMGINDQPAHEYNAHLYTVPSEASPFKLVNIGRLLYRYTQIVLRRHIDLVVHADPDRLIEKAVEFKRLGIYSEAEVYLKRSLELSPTNTSAYMELSLVYGESYRLAEAKQLLLKMLALDTMSSHAHNELGVFYREMLHNPEIATSYFESAIALDPDNGQAYLDYALNILYFDKPKAMELLKRAIILRPDLDWAYINLAELNERNGNIAEAERLYSEVLKRDATNEIALMKLGHLRGDKKLSGEVAGVSDSTVSSRSAWSYHDMTRQNYSRMISAAAANKISVVAMQYPLQPVEPLEQLVDDVKVPAAQVTVVGNVENFKEALQASSYDVLFVDKFRDTFGHATKAGNELIAKNVMKAIDGMIPVPAGK